MLAVPANNHEAKAIGYVDQLASEYAGHLSKARSAAQRALNALLDAGIDPEVSLQIVNVKFRVLPPKDVGSEPETIHQLDMQPALKVDFVDEEEDGDETEFAGSGY